MKERVITPHTEYEAPCKAMYDAFHDGLIECTVLRVNHDCDGNQAVGPKKALNVRIDEDRGAYKKGEIIQTTGCSDVPPVSHVSTDSDGKYKINVTYKYVTSKEGSDD